MGQKLDKAPKGAYDAIVYIDGSEVVAEDSNGRKISSGVAGVNDSSVIQSAVDFVFVLGGGKVYCCGDTYYHSTTIDVKSKVVLEYSPSNIYPIADVDLFHVAPSGSLTATGNVTIDVTDIVFTSDVFFVGIDAYSAETPTNITGPFYLIGDRTGNAIHVEASPGCIWGVVVRGTRVYGLNYGILLESTVSFINSCEFSDIILHRCVYPVYGVPGAGSMDANTFNVIIEPDIWTVTGFVYGGRGSDITVTLWDWADLWAMILAKGIWLTAGSVGNTIHAFTHPTCVTNTGVYNTFLYRNTGSSHIDAPQLQINGFPLSKITYDHIVVVSPTGGDYNTLSAALAAITTANVSNRFVILVFGAITDTSFASKSYIDVVGFGAIITTSAACTFGAKNTTWRSIELISTSTGANGFTISYVDETTIFDSVVFRRIAASGTFHTIRSDPTASARLINCSIYGADLIDCHAMSLDHGNSLNLTNCRIYPGTGGNARGGISIAGACSTKCYNCVISPQETTSYVLYTSANNGRILPVSGHPYEVIWFAFHVLSAQVGITVNIGSTPGGSDIASGISMTASGIIPFSFNVIPIVSGGYIYITPSAGIPEGSIRIHYTAIQNYASNIVSLVNKNNVDFEQCTIKASGLSTPLYFATNDSSVDSRFVRCSFRNYESGGSAILAISAVSGACIIDCDVIGTITNVTGIDGKSSSSSTGTGSEQTIAHGLAAIPTGCKAWIKYLVGARYITEMVPFDATNIYPTVETGVAYEWRIE